MRYLQGLRFAITTSLAAPRDALRAAREAADRWRVPFVDRSAQALAEVAAGAGVPALLVLTPERAAIWTAGILTPWDAGMGALRLKRLRCGETSTLDGFLDAAELRPGEALLDCTLGFGADALVAAEALGPAGRVVGLEASAPLAALTSEGLRRLRDPAAERITVHHAEASSWLAEAAPASFDVVAFDPMFRHPRAQPPGFDVLRQLALAEPLAAETLARARRVARRAVLVKDGAPGLDLARLGLRPLRARRAAQRCYARIEVGRSE